MKPLLETSSPLYLKRLVRALNSEARTGNGFYLKHGPGSVLIDCRCNRARFNGAGIECLDFHGYWHPLQPGDTLEDCNSREIVASRRQ